MARFRHLACFVRRANADGQRHEEHQPPDNDVDDDAGRPGHNKRRLKPDNMNLRQGAPAKLVPKDTADGPN